MAETSRTLEGFFALFRFPKRSRARIQHLFISYPNIVQYVRRVLLRNSQQRVVYESSHGKRTFDEPLARFNRTIRPYVTQPDQNGKRIPKLTA